MRLARTIIVAAGIAVAVCLLAPVAMFVAMGGLVSCENTVEQSVSSPNGKHRVDVFTRDCGATTRYSTHISIVPAGAAPPAEGGNVFTAYQTSVRVRWRGADVLEIAHGADTTVFHQNARVRGVAITYAPLVDAPPPEPDPPGRY